MDLELNDKVAVITGPAKGMGAAISLGFAREGTHLALPVSYTHLTLPTSYPV